MARKFKWVWDDIEHFLPSEFWNVLRCARVPLFQTLHCLLLRSAWNCTIFFPPLSLAATRVLYVPEVLHCCIEFGQEP
ncbi:hypothetical protein GOP47_0019972 [Adiantum capillus-veneris]|uniref:Uncharacterized protein n=1 Tax=Adiantum capillus-veneris TaxID=13818 RepID=A0A9D4UCT0_ADICA|nr:hypothetical protein GOP47_0019972 [Adiantum capillus-veneris]